MKKPVKAKEQLQTEGWHLASVTGGNHLKRILEMYQELGIEVYLEEAKSEECAECSDCYKAANEAIYTIYTRAKDKQAEERHNAKD